MSVVIQRINIWNAECKSNFSFESLESGEATTSFSCTGSISALPFVSLITLAGIVVFIRKRK